MSKTSERQGVNHNFYFNSLNLTRQELYKSGGLPISELMLKFLAQFHEEGLLTGITDL